MRTLLKYAKKYKLQIFFQLFFATIWVISQLIIPTLMAQIIDLGIMKSDNQYILTRGGLMIIASLVNLGSILSTLYFLTHVNAGISRDMRTDVFEKILSWREKTRYKFSSSTLITRNINDVKQVSNFIDLSLRKIYTLTITIIGSVVLSFLLDVNLSLIMFLIIPFVLFITMKLTSSAVPQYTKIREATDDINKLFRQNLTGIRVVRAFGKSDFEQERFADSVDEAYKANVKAENTMILLAPLVTFFVNILILSILWYGGIRLENGFIQLGVMVAVIEYVIMALTNVQSLSSIITIIPRAKVSLERIEEVLKNDENFSKTHSKLNEKNKFGIEINDLTFFYPNAEYSAIDGLNATFELGKTYAIIGSTGSGKSTFIKILLRDYDMTSGQILINGIDIRDFSEKQLNQKITIIPQKTFLFAGTIRENIKVGKKNATDEEIWRVLDICQMGEFFRNSKDGLDTMISQNAVNLSGGQKQRISLARGIIRDADFYIFDDSFSALDFTTEKKIREEISNFLNEKTKIVVAQRIATVQNADEILVMSDGKIVDRGKHEELIRSSLIYQEIFASQIREER